MHPLVVEDDLSLARTLKYILEEHGLEVLVARDGEDALDLLGVSRVPNLIILDLVLPRLDGWNLLEILRGVSSVPIIAMSGLSTADLRPRSAVVLQKPLDLEELLGEVDRCLGAATIPRPRLAPPA